MTTLVSDSPGLRTRTSQDETSPFPLEFMVISRRSSSRNARASQDETSPFPLEFEVIARKARVNHDETSPFPLEFMVMLPDGEAAVARIPDVHRSRDQSSRDNTSRERASLDKALPRLKFRGIDASPELREYVARVACGEDLPPFRGPVLASGEFPWSAPKASDPESGNGARAFLKLALGLMVLSAAVVASAVLGDDAELRAAGQSIGSWFMGGGGSFERPPTVEAAGRAADGPCETKPSELTARDEAPR
jgi:hypothetical protein